MLLTLVKSVNKRVVLEIEKTEVVPKDRMKFYMCTSCTLAVQQKFREVMCVKWIKTKHTSYF
jgi:hypothetical protein